MLMSKYKCPESDCGGLVYGYLTIIRRLALNEKGEPLSYSIEHDEKGMPVGIARPVDDEIVKSEARCELCGATFITKTSIRT